MTRAQSISLIFLGVLALGLLVASWVPAFREAVRAFVLEDQRKILAKVEGEFSFDVREPRKKTQVIVLKIREGRDLLVEIYKVDQTRGMSLWSDFRFENETDSYLTQGMKTSNLSLTDIKNDGVFRVVIPALDSRLNPRVHVLEYSQGLDRFVLLKEQDIRDHL